MLLFFSIILSVQDIKNLKISNLMIFLGISISTIIHLLLNISECWHYYISALSFGLFYLLCWIISKRKLGLGDVYFGIFQGLFVQVKWLPVVIGIEVIFALFYVLFKKRDRPFCFIPFMSLSLFITFILSLLFDI